MNGLIGERLALVQRQLAECQRECERFEDGVKLLQKVANEDQGEIDSLKQQLEVASVDAERYRWLRKSENTDSIIRDDCRGVYAVSMDALDILVDIAMGKEPNAI
jgi:hypothetical protein